MYIEDSGWSLSLPLLLRFTFFVLLLFNLSPVEGEYQVIGSLQPVVAVVGGDVVLPCYVEPELDVVDLTVEWSDPDLKPDPNDRLHRVNYVHLYRDNREVLDMKIPSYFRRTALFTDGLRRGNVSLKITNVTYADEGRYKCFIPKLKSQGPFPIITLIVAESWTTETPLLPKNLQTPDPTEGMYTTDGFSHRSQLIAPVVSCVCLIIAVGGCLFIALMSKGRKCKRTSKLSSLTRDMSSMRSSDPGPLETFEVLKQVDMICDGDVNRRI